MRLILLPVRVHVVALGQQWQGSGKRGEWVGQIAGKGSTSHNRARRREGCIMAHATESKPSSYPP